LTPEEDMERLTASRGFRNNKFGLIWHSSCW